MTPTWAVVLVGLGSGLAGSLATAFVTISHERASELRAHMLNAADEFSTGAISALMQIRTAAGEVKKDTVPLDDPNSAWWRADIKEHFDAANAAVDGALAKQARVHLLFGDQSDAGIAAAGVTSQLGGMVMAVEHRPDSIRDHGEMSRYSRYFGTTLEQHEKFNLTALVALQQTWWDRLRGRHQLRSRSRETS
jgi:hypothetical protein